MRISKNLGKISASYRRDILNMAINAGSGHIGPAFSIIDIITVLYYSILKVNPQDPIWEDRDRFLLSKGHGCAALYVVLAGLGFFPKEELNKFCRMDGILGGHPERGKIPGVEISSGSLGHGLSIGTGIALAAKFDKKKYRTFVLMGDGECQEGSVWEAAMSAAQFKLDNLVAIVDYNKFQAVGPTKYIMSLEPFAEKWRSFGWAVNEINGHNFDEILDCMRSLPFSKNKPNLVVAHTIKGKGVSFMENKSIWHYRIPDKEEIEQAMKELKQKI